MCTYASSRVKRKSFSGKSELQMFLLQFPAGICWFSAIDKSDLIHFDIDFIDQSVEIDDSRAWFNDLS